MTNAKHEGKTWKIEFGRDPSQSNLFRYTFEDKLEEEMAGAKHASQDSKMEYPSPPNQFQCIFEDELEEEMTSAKRASQTSKTEFRRDIRPPNQFR